MLITQIIIMVLALILLVVFGVISRKKNKVEPKYFSISIALGLALIYFFRYMLGHEPIYETFELVNTVYSTKFLTSIMLLLSWCEVASILVVILYPFFKCTGLRVILKFFALPIFILSACAIYPLTLGLIGDYLGFDIRIFLFGLEIGVALGYLVYLEIVNFKEQFIRRDYLALLYIIPMLIFTLPIYMLSGLFGFANYAIEVKGFSLPHRVLLYFSIIIPVIIYLLLKNKDKKIIKLCLLYISLGALISFSAHHKLESFANPLNWPLHLCNTALYIIPLCLIFKMNKLFYFTYFINVLGAFLAMAMPNYSSANNIFSVGISIFYINHYIAFFMPLLMVALKVYDRPKIREFKYSMVGFLIYFVLVLVFNAWFSNYGFVDYFFVNSDYVADKLGEWAENLRNFVWSFNISGLTFTFYPIYQLLFFIVYVAMGAGVWFLYEGAYTFVDTIYDIISRKNAIKLDMLALQVERANREGNKMKGNNKASLILRDFSKRYGKSDVYAVKDANLEIKSGEIFGFLGHNGAGKSTIIKSIVGIQPITSGKIEVCGYDVDRESTEAKRNIGFVPDHYALYERLTGREYINYIADLYGVSAEDRTEAINKYVDIFELSEAFDNQIKTYSHGMKQKIAIMSALVHSPKVWILDEPLTGLDPASIYQVKKCMKEHAKRGNIVFFSSHLIDIVESLCDRIAIIKKGKILVTKDVKEIEAEKPLEEYYMEITKTQVIPTRVSSEKSIDQESVETPLRKSILKKGKKSN